MKFVDGFQRAWRWFSIQAMVLAGALQGAWMYVPESLQKSLPHGLIQGLTIALLAAGVAGRLVKQDPPQEPKAAP